MVGLISLGGERDVVGGEREVVVALSAPFWPGASWSSHRQLALGVQGAAAGYAGECLPHPGTVLEPTQPTAFQRLLADGG
jgi:hypothetical protein